MFKSLRLSTSPKILYTEIIGDSLYFWPTTARVGNFTKVRDSEAVEARGRFAIMGYTFIPLQEARARISA